MNVQNRELSIDTIDFAESIEFPSEFKLKTEIKDEDESCTDNVKSETIIRPKFDPRESLNSGQSEIKGETTSCLEVKGIKKEIVEEVDVLNKNVKIETKDDEPMLEFLKNIEFSDDVEPKVEVKAELTEPKKETDDEFQNGISVMEKMDDSDFNGETFTNDSLPQQNLTSPSGSENSQFDVDPKNPFQCLICPSKFGKKGALNRHISTVHEGNKPHKCQNCSASFSQKTDLKYHFASVHEGKKPHKCSKCESSFVRKNMLRRHMESVHEGKKPHKCPICDERL